MSIQNYVNELMEGKGYFILSQLFNAAQVKEARDIIMHHSDRASGGVTHFHGGHEGKITLQRRVWNLLNKGQIFVDMVQHPRVVEIMRAFLGSEFCLGSIAANRILPGGPGQEPHIDYPYWDMYKRASFPHNMNPSFPLNCQVTVILDDFTEQSGATAILPGSQTWNKYPDEEDAKKFYKEATRLTGKPGDVAVFYGMAWHCAMPNQSDHDRTGVLIQYLPKFIKPMEDQKRGVNPEVVASATPVLKQLLGYDFPYPQILEEAEEGNTEGRQQAQS